MKLHALEQSLLDLVVNVRGYEDISTAIGNCEDGACVCIGQSRNNNF